MHKYSVSWIRLIIEPVYDRYNTWVVNNLFLIQLKVNKGEQYCLYEDGEHEVFKLLYGPQIFLQVYISANTIKKYRTFTFKRFCGTAFTILFHEISKNVMPQKFKTTKYCCVGGMNLVPY